jgi:hypothetical protein
MPMRSPLPGGPILTDSPQLDQLALRRLLALTWDAISEQELHAQDQLTAALHAGATSIRIEQSALAPVIVVEVGGVDLFETDIRNVLPWAD